MSASRTPVAQITRYLSWLIAAILVLLPFHAYLTTWAGSSFGHLDTWRLWKEFLIVAMLPAIAWLVWQEPALQKWFKSSWFVRLFGLYVFLHFILAAWALHRGLVNHTALIDGLLTNLRFPGFFIVCAVAASLDGFLKRYWAQLTLGPAVIVVVFGLLQRFILPLNFLAHFGYGAKTIQAYQTVDAHSGPPRIQSTLRGPNPLGAYLVLILPAWLVAVKPRIWKIAGGLSISAAIVLSYSRSALVAAGLVAALLAWWLASRGQKKLLLASGVVLLVGLSLVGYIDRNHSYVQETLFHTSSHSTSPISSNAERASSLRHAWHDIVHQPLGRGPGTAGPASEHNNHPARIAENYYLQIGQEVGVIGIVLFIAMNLVVARELWLRRADNLALVLLISLAGISLINLVSHAWADDTISLLWWGLAGIATAPVILKTKR